jgi:hypothetical protein
MNNALLRALNEATRELNRCFYALGGVEPRRPGALVEPVNPSLWREYATAADTYFAANEQWRDRWSRA